MKTQKLNITLLTLTVIAALNLIGCGKSVRFDNIIRTPASLEAPEPLDPGEPTGSIEGPELDPSEPTGPVTPPVVNPPVVNTKTELFIQGSGGKVDILFVIDNSPSMQKEQKKLGEKLRSFMTGLDNTDWQIAFTTTDVSNGPYGLKGSFQNLAGHGTDKILTSNYADAETVFLQTVQRSEIASSDEQPLKASILAMQKHNAENAGFFRSDADLAIIVLSDENEMSRGISSKATKPAQVVDAFKSIFGTTKKLAVYGIIIQSGDETCYADQKGSGNFQNASYGTFVEELSRITGGFTGSICDADYSQNLLDIGNGVRLLADHFILEKTPLAGSVQVTLSPNQSIPWTVEGNKLSFATPPQDRSLIQVTYSHAP